MSSIEGNRNGPGSLNTDILYSKFKNSRFGNLKTEETAKIIFELSKKDNNIKEAIELVKKEINYTSSLSKKSEFINFLSNKNILDSVINKLSPSLLKKVESAFNAQIVQNASPQQFLAEAQAIVTIFQNQSRTEELHFLKNLAQTPNDRQLAQALSTALLKDPIKRAEYEKFFSGLKEPTKKEIGLLKTQLILKSQEQISESLDIAKKTVPRKGNLNPNFLVETLNTVPEKHFDILSQTFNSPLSRDGLGNTIDPPIALGSTPPSNTAWLIMGSNDLKQVERAYKKWASLDPNKRPHVFCFSGYGGHGTVHGPIFHHTEAEMMQEYFMYLAEVDGKSAELQKCTFIVENQSTNSGQNAEFIKLKLDAYNTNKSQENTLSHFVVFGVPPAIARQVLTVEKNFKGFNYSFTSVSGYPPSNEEIEKKYFAERSYTLPKELAKPTYLLCAYREASTFLNYTITQDFMAPYLPSQKDIEKTAEVFNEAAELFFEKELKQGKPIPHIDHPAQFAQGVHRIGELKKKGKLSPEETAELQALKSKLAPQIQPFDQYFRQAFSLLEEVSMPILPPGNIKDQAEEIGRERVRPWLREDIKNL